MPLLFLELAVGIAVGVAATLGAVIVLYVRGVSQE